MRKQAERCSPSHVDLHINRQRLLGERMIGEKDCPRAIELLVTGLLVAMVFTANYVGWM